MKKFRENELFTLILVLILSVCAEIFVFNFRYFQQALTGGPEKTLQSADLTPGAGCTSSEDLLSLQKGADFSVKNPGVPVDSVHIDALADYPFTVSVSYTDAASSRTQIDAGSWTIDPRVPGTENIRFITAGNCGSIRFFVSDAVGTVSVHSAVLNRPYFHFQWMRALLLFVLLAAFPLRRAKVLRARVGDERGIHTPAFNCLCFFFIAAALFSLGLYAGYSDAAGFTRDVSGSTDLYQLLTEALSHARLSLLPQPPAQLTALANPYDPSLRDFSYLFDSAYYGGHYYCYFGLTPVLTLMLPVKLLTGIYLPSSFGCLVYMLVLLFAVLALYYNIVMKWYPALRLSVFAAGAAALVFGSNLFWLIARPMFYELAVLSALSFLFLALSLLVYASRREGPPARLLLLSGLCFGLMVASRPTFLFYLAAAVPLLLPQFLDRRGGRTRVRIRPLAAFFSPLAVFAVLLMAYNALRFGSPFDFGQKYQLTISDVRYNSLFNLAALPGGLYHYFFAPLSFDLTFPFFHVVRTTPQVSAGYYYNEPMAGIFNLPLLLILFALCHITKRMPRKPGMLKGFCRALAACAGVIAALDILLAGVLQRYSMDILPAFAVCAMILWFEVLSYFEQKGAQRPVYKLFYAVCGLTAVISTLSTSCGEYSIQLNNISPLLAHLRLFFEFWR